MKLMILTAAVWPTEEIARQKLWIFLKSCDKYGITPQLYGCGHAFPGYIHMKLDMQLEWLNGHQGGFTHVLYMDGWDGMITGPKSEIIRKYKEMGSPPILSSAYFDLGNVSHLEDYDGCFNEDSIYKYPNVGGYIAEIPAIIEAFTMMNRDTGDDCFSWYDGWRDGWFRPELDSGCEIFQVTDKYAHALDGRLFNRVTGTFPCVLHLSGGYTDPETGKDAVMEPWARRLGVL